MLYYGTVLWHSSLSHFMQLQYPISGCQLEPWLPCFQSSFLLMSLGSYQKDWVHESLPPQGDQNVEDPDGTSGYWLTHCYRHLESESWTCDIEMFSFSLPPLSIQLSPPPSIHLLLLCPLCFKYTNLISWSSLFFLTFKKDFTNAKNRFHVSWSASDKTQRQGGSKMILLQ